MNNSIWMEQTQLPEFPCLRGDRKTDVLIVGGGLTGLLCAWQLRQAGIDYLLIEADRICAGTSGKTTAKITSQHGLIYDKLMKRYGAETARIYYDANHGALEDYRRLCRTIDCDFESKDNYIYTLDAPQKLERELRALEALDIPSGFTKELPLPFHTAGAVFFPDQAQFHPLKFAASLSRELQILERTPARAFVGNTVLTDYGRITAQKIIIATHFPLINKHGFYFAKEFQSRSYVIALDNAPQLNGMYRDEAETGFSFRNAGSYLLLGGGSHRTGTSAGGWAPLENAARSWYLSSRPQYRWAAQDCMTLDSIPYIGRYSKGTSDLYVATGFHKWGMTSAMAASAILSDLVQGKDNPYAGVFSPQRSSLHPQLVVNMLESAWNLVRPSVPRCPHLGCALKWNSQERSWDCPCHGSRFDENGVLLDNPANGDLKRKP